MRKIAILLCMFIFVSTLSISAFAEAASSDTTSSSEATSSASSDVTSEPGEYNTDVSLGGGLKNHLKDGASNVKDSKKAALDDLENMDYGGYGDFMGQALASIPSEIWAAFALMVLCMIVRAALALMAG